MSDLPLVPKNAVDEAEREYFTRVMDEAREARNHDINLAKVESAKQIDLARIKASGRDERRVFWYWIIAALFVLSVGAGIWAIVNNVNSGNRSERLQKEQLQQQTAQACIKAGNIWANNNCLISGKSTS